MRIQFLASFTFAVALTLASDAQAKGSGHGHSHGRAYTVHPVKPFHAKRFKPAKYPHNQS